MAPAVAACFCSATGLSITPDDQGRWVAVTLNEQGRRQA
jgi:hypothetical protein